MSNDEPKPAEEQFASMKANLENGQREALCKGIPPEHIVYVLRNNIRSHMTEFDGLGGVFYTLESAIKFCTCVLEVGYLHENDLYDVHVIDGRDHTQIRTLLHANYPKKYAAATVDTVTAQFQTHTLHSSE